MGTVTIDMMLILFYISPFIILLFSKKINTQFNLVNIPVKVVDLLIPYLIILIYAFGRLYLQLNLIPYIIIIISVLGIVLVTYNTFVKHALNIYYFFRLWWRYVFLILMTGYIAIGIGAVYQVVV